MFSYSSDYVVDGDSHYVFVYEPGDFSLPSWSGVTKTDNYFCFPIKFFYLSRSEHQHYKQVCTEFHLLYDPVKDKVVVEDIPFNRPLSSFGGIENQRFVLDKWLRSSSFSGYIKHELQNLLDSRDSGFHEEEHNPVSILHAQQIQQMLTHFLFLARTSYQDVEIRSATSI